MAEHSDPLAADAAHRFDDATVAGVTGHMNADHGADTLLICRTAGGRPTATAATMVGLDGHGGDYVVTIDGVEESLRIAWSRPLTERAEIRAEVVRLYDEACAELGIEPRPH